MKAFLIDPDLRTITEVEDPDFHLSELYRLLSVSGLRPVDDINCVQLRHDACIYVDGEGALIRDNGVWQLGNYPSPLMGKGLAIGLNAEGDNADWPEDLTRSLYASVKWTELETTGNMSGAGPTAYGHTLGSPVLAQRVRR